MLGQLSCDYRLFLGRSILNLVSEVVPYSLPYAPGESYISVFHAAQVIT